MTSGVINFGPFHFGDWTLDCDKKPAVTFTSAFKYGYSFAAQKKEVEKGFLDKVSGWLKSLFGEGGGREELVKHAWEEFAGGEEGYVAVSAIASVIEDPCKDGKKKYFLQCYLHFEVWYGADARVQSQGLDAKAKMALQFDVTLPETAKVPVGECNCPTAAASEVLIVSGQAVRLITPGVPQIAIAEGGAWSPVPPMEAVALGAEAPVVAAKRAAAKG